MNQAMFFAAVQATSGGGGGGGGGLLLDTLTTAPYAAYSTRKLKTGVTTAIQAVRQSDSATLDIGFVSGDLDTASLLTFAQGGNVDLVIWYDQSGNGHHLTPDRSAWLPNIVNAGALTLLKTGGKPAPKFDQNNTQMLSPSFSIPSTTTIMEVAAWGIGSSWDDFPVIAAYLGTGDSGTDWAGSLQTFVRQSSSSTLFIGQAATGPASAVVPTSGPISCSMHMNPAGMSLRVNGGTDITSSGQFKTLTATGQVVVGARGSADNIGEIIRFASVNVPDKLACEASQKAYWGTP